MCGIVGYLGEKPVVPLLLDGLKRLEYRGYDSAGVAVLQKDGLKRYRTNSKIARLEKILNGEKIESCLGIGHTRWATHGEPSVANAHPHLDCTGKIAVVHNGIIENYKLLRSHLEEEGHKFTSTTDTEVLAHLIEKYYVGDLAEAVRKSLAIVEGTYGLAVICQGNPEKIVVARCGSPLVIGVGKGEYFVASDIAVLLPYTRDVVYLEDYELAVLEKTGFTTTTIENIFVTKEIKKIDWDIMAAEKGGFPHFMLKEIHEQPEAIRNTLRGRLLVQKSDLHLGGPNLTEREIQNIKRIVIVACGTSWHAGLVGEYFLEELTRLPVEVEYASEFRYRNPVVNKGELVIAISQSGETADTLAAIREAKKKHTRVLGIVNVVGSSIAREVGRGIYIHAGPEIGVASTKAFTAQLAALYMFALLISKVRRGFLQDRDRELIKELGEIPDKIQRVLAESSRIQAIAQKYFIADHSLYLGRGYNYPVALEGALKLKEISYVHAEGYPAAEMKHGPIALIDKCMPTVVIAPQDSVYEKIISNIEEVKTRGGIVIAIATEGDSEISKIAEDTIYIPSVSEPLVPFLSVIPLQLLAYYIAVKRGCDVDQPRNLAKSVTVE